MKITCLDTNKKTKINWDNSHDEQLSDAINDAATRLIRREEEFKIRGHFIDLKYDEFEPQSKYRAEVVYLVGGLTEHTGKYRTFKIEN